jgi:putative selenium metabolism protein SsnA
MNEPTNDQILIGNGLLVTLGPENRIMDGGAVAVEGERIVAVGTTDSLRDRYPEARFLDAGGRLIMPGLVNCHMHLYSTFACGLAFAPAQNFVEILENLWWKLDRALSAEDVYYSALIPLMRCIKAGTTTIIDHHASPGVVRGSLRTIGRACEEAGVRSCLCYEVTDRGGSEEARAGIEENVEWLKSCSENKGGLLTGLFGLHASLTLGDDTLAACAEAARGLDTGFHVHVAEDAADQEDSLRKYGKRVVERFRDHGILGPKSLACHCVHVDEGEMDMLRESGTRVIHNPQSNMNNAVGAADILMMIEKGLTVGLGTDGMTSNMFDELRACYLLQHHVKGDPRVAFGEAVEMLTVTNPKIASSLLPREVGVLKEEACADIILVDYFPYTPLTAENFGGHFMFGIASAPVDTVIVGGRTLMQEGKLLDLDEREISRRAIEYSRSTWDRF